MIKYSIIIIGDEMKKIKEIWKNNKIVVILCVILLICTIAIGYVALTYFFGGSSSAYGDRLDNIDDYPFTDDDMSDLEDSISEDERITSVSVRLSGKIIYISASFEEDISLSAAKKYAVATLDLIDEDLLNYYDLNYTVSSSEFTLMGYKNSVSTSIVWNNDTDFETESE